MDASCSPGDRAARTLLLVEDDKHLRDALAAAMEARGFSVTIAAGVRAALDEIERREHAFAVIDLALQDGSGLEVARRLVSRRPDTRFLIMSGYGDIRTAVAAIKLGAADFITKPVDADDIASVLTSDDRLPSRPAPTSMSPQRVRWEHIQAVLTECSHNVSEAARKLQMHRRTLQRILAKRAPR